MENLAYRLVFTNDETDCSQKKIYVSDLIRRINLVQASKPYAGSDIHALSRGLCKRIRFVKEAKKSTENFLLIATSEEGLVRACEETHLPFLKDKVESYKP